MVKEEHAEIWAELTRSENMKKTNSPREVAKDQKVTTSFRSRSSKPNKQRPLRLEPVCDKGVLLALLPGNNKGIHKEIGDFHEAEGFL